MRLLTGLRIAELSDLRVKDLVDNQTVVSVPRGKTRNARRVVPLPIAAPQVVALRMADPPTLPLTPLFAITASLMGQERGTIALDLYSGGAALDALKAAVADLEDRGLHGEVVQALGETLDQRPRMVRFAPVGAEKAAA
ncbi:MAG TPA: hypothetical protein VHT74_31035 [Acetobacteraceae bacterium]|nr:hypothetical protein [Acetobacteraceae bacterium]